MAQSKLATAIAVSHLGDAVLEAMELLRRAAAARSVFLHDADVGHLATMGDPFNARQRRLIAELVRQGPGDDSPHWMWPTIRSTLARFSAGDGYTVVVIRDDGPIPISEALDLHLERLAARLPTRAPRRGAALPPARPADKPALCSFCGNASGEGRRLVSGRGVAICDECVVLCQEAFAGHKTPVQAAQLQHRAASMLDAAQRDLAGLKFGDAMGNLQGAESALAELLALIAPLLPARNDADNAGS